MKTENKTTETLQEMEEFFNACNSYAEKYEVEEIPLDLIDFDDD